MEQLNRANKKRRVMIGTPCYDGRIDVWYVNSLSNTVKMSFEKNVEIIPMWISFDALIQRARNDTLDLAITMDVDDIIWIDSDIEWEPEHFYRLLDHPVDIVGGTYRKKGDREEYVLREFPNITKVSSTTGLMSVQGLGTGFVRMSKKAFMHLWDSSRSYIDPKDDRERRMAFDVVIEDFPLNGKPKPVPTMISEDIYAFQKLIQGGFDVWLDPDITCNHTGPYKFKGDFRYWFESGAFLETDKIGAPAVASDPRLRTNEPPKFNITPPALRKQAPQQIQQAPQPQVPKSIPRSYKQL